MNFRFLHAADLHLDSPLLGLSSKSYDFAKSIENASRRAFENLIDLAIKENCRFVVLAGDIFDGDLRNYETGLFFAKQLGRLRDSNIDVYIVLGNHDADNQFARKLKMTENVFLFDFKKPQSFEVSDLNVILHGRSFPQKDVRENIAKDYPSPENGKFNIGVLHTACQGSEEYHAPYAPCSVEQLVNHGYEYWALGHVHSRKILHESPYVVYPGNLQGRNPREVGPKGATIIQVIDLQVSEIVHHDLDVIRWLDLSVDVSSCDSWEELVPTIRQQIIEFIAEAGDRALAIRLRIEGKTELHHLINIKREELRSDIEILMAGFSNDVWLERLITRTEPVFLSEDLDKTISGRLTKELLDVSNEEITFLLDKHLDKISSKIPAGAHLDSFLQQLREDAPSNARSLAVSLIANTDTPDADQ